MSRQKYFLNGPIPASFSVYFNLLKMLQFKFKFKLKKAQMVCLGFKPMAAGWKAQMNPLSYGGTPTKIIVEARFAKFTSASSIYNIYLPSGKHLMEFFAAKLGKASIVTYVSCFYLIVFL